MRVTTFLRIARSARGYRVVASSKRPNEPLRNPSDDRALPTFVVYLLMELPDDVFTVPTAQVEIEPSQIEQIEAIAEEVA